MEDGVRKLDRDRVGGKGRRENGIRKEVSIEVVSYLDKCIVYLFFLISKQTKFRKAVWLLVPASHGPTTIRQAEAQCLRGFHRGANITSCQSLTAFTSLAWVVHPRIFSRGCPRNTSANRQHTIVLLKQRRRSECGGLFSCINERRSSKRVDRSYHKHLTQFLFERTKPSERRQAET